MAKIRISALSEGYGWGATVAGLTLDMLDDADVRAEMQQLFEDRGLILFRDCGETEIQIEISKLFGPLKEFPVGKVHRVEGQPLLIDLRQDPDDSPTVEIGGKIMSEYSPWHFDHCFYGTLNRGGVLRPVKIARDGGETGFIDGIEAYERLSPEHRVIAEQIRILYKAEYEFNLRFWKPDGFKVLHISQYNLDVSKDMANNRRAIHPMAFTRESDGRKVVHLSPWMAEGIEGDETPQGAALLTELMHEVIDNATPYFHRWQPGDLIAWDNWRMMHAVNGHPAEQPRQMHRTTIVGDYGLGSLESEPEPAGASVA